MPAIDLTKLKQQCAELIILFDQPDVFLQQLKDILDFYTNRTLRVSQVIQKSNLPTYNTPRPVILQIENTIEKLGELFPEAAINLSKALWDTSIYEARLLSAFILGTIPLPSSISLLTSLPEKLYETKDQGIKNALLTSALARLRNEDPHTMMILVKEWLNAPGPKTKTWGLNAFLPLVQKLGYDDLPQIFEILRPVIITMTPATLTDIQACINSIYLISPVETIHFLTDIIQETKEEKILSMLMQIFRDLPLNAQNELNAVVKNVSLQISLIK
ncbi:MAG: hypothetical protein ABIJ65_04395 [Chloroflexota bacterium]